MKKIGTDSSAILCLPEYIDPDKAGLWWCIDPEDVLTLRENAVCKAATAEWADIAEEAESIDLFRFVFVCAPPGAERDEIVQKLMSRIHTPVLVPCADAFHGCKNIRSLLASHGALAVDRLLFGAEELPVHGLIDLADVDCEKRLNAERVLSGFRELDSSIGGFSPGELSVWTGKRGEGKSTLLGQILLEAVNQGHRVCAYSGELPARQFKLSMLQQAAGYRNVKKREDERSGRVFFDVKPEAGKAIDEWWRGRLFLTDIQQENAHDEDNILRLFKYAHRRYGCDVFLADNIMTVALKGAAELGYWQAQSAFTGRLVAFAKGRGIHVHLVAHPRKTDKRLEADDVGGSADITNRADNVFKVERVKDEMVEQAGHSMLLTVLKNREFGAAAKIELSFNPASRRFYPARGGDRRIFSWERAASGGGA